MQGQRQVTTGRHPAKEHPWEAARVPGLRNWRHVEWLGPREAGRDGAWAGMGGSCRALQVRVRVGFLEHRKPVKMGIMESCHLIWWEDGALQ